MKLNCVILVLIMSISISFWACLSLDTSQTPSKTQPPGDHVLVLTQSDITHNINQENYTYTVVPETRELDKGLQDNGWIADPIATKNAAFYCEKVMIERGFSLVAWDTVNTNNNESFADMFQVIVRIISRHSFHMLSVLIWDIEAKSDTPVWLCVIDNIDVQNYLDNPMHYWLRIIQLYGKPDMQQDMFW